MLAYTRMYSVFVLINLYLFIYFLKFAPPMHETTSRVSSIQLLLHSGTRLDSSSPFHGGKQENWLRVGNLGWSQRCSRCHLRKAHLSSGNLLSASQTRWVSVSEIRPLVAILMPT